ncbi:MAG: hypothetical protein PHI34_14475 [Acidobacteriota bacterium]|nr:hypothetical protein [Acidobacteriota bacterium]
MKTKAAILILGLALLLVGCTSYYTLINETPPSANLGSFSTLSIGWLDFGEGRAKDYGFEGNEAGKWVELINEINLKAFPKYVKEFLPGKTLLHVQSKAEPPKKEGLIIEFSEVNYKQQTSTGAQIMFGAWAGSDMLDLTVHFIDAKSGQELAVSKISLSAKAGTGYSQYSFEGRFNNAVYNLAKFVAEKTS